MIISKSDTARDAMYGIFGHFLSIIQMSRGNNYPKGEIFFEK